MADLSNVKVGDKVIQIYKRCGIGETITIETVCRITKTGFIGVGDNLFYVDGTPRTRNTHMSIEEWSLEKEHEIKKEERLIHARKECINRFEQCKKDLTYKQVRYILHILNNGV